MKRHSKDFLEFKTKFNRLLDENVKANRLNKLARKFYKVMGYEVAEGFDFSAARHGENFVIVTSNNNLLLKFCDT